MLRKNYLTNKVSITMSTNLVKESQDSNIKQDGSADERSLSKHFIDLGTLAEISAVKESLYNYISTPKEVKTPAEKVKKRPDGFDYVESSWMDYQTKLFMPSYEYQLLHISYQHGWINVIVSLKDKLTGNTELGADSARIMVRKDAEEPSFRDIIDMGNNLKSALSKAIKNAQSRFGVSADVYQKRESVPSDGERQRFETILAQIAKISPSRAKIFQDQWADLGTDWSEFMDKWQVYVDRNTVKPAVS